MDWCPIPGVVRFSPTNFSWDRLHPTFPPCWTSSYDDRWIEIHMSITMQDFLRYQKDLLSLLKKTRVKHCDTVTFTHYLIVQLLTDPFLSVNHNLNR